MMAALQQENKQLRFLLSVERKKVAFYASQFGTIDQVHNRMVAQQQLQMQQQQQQQQQ